jgi:hypothetical protein
MKRVLLACSLPLLFSLLNWQEPPAKQEAVCRGRPVAVSRLEYGGIKRSGTRIPFTNGGPQERARIVFRDRAEFDKFWQQTFNSPTYKAPPPEVDFSRDMLIVAAMGAQPSPVYTIIVESACEVDNKLEVLVHSTDYSLCGAQLGVVVQPMDMVRVPKTDLPVVFRETEIVSDCKQLLRP